MFQEITKLSILSLALGDMLPEHWRNQLKTSIGQRRLLRMSPLKTVLWREELESTQEAKLATNALE
jgi:hypothetical protein